jgi:hypothetical protein
LPVNERKLFCNYAWETQATTGSLHRSTAAHRNPLSQSDSGDNVVGGDEQQENTRPPGDGSLGRTDSR